jgi:thermitase
LDTTLAQSSNRGTAMPIAVDTRARRAENRSRQRLGPGLRLFVGLVAVVSPLLWATAFSSPSLGMSASTEQRSLEAADLARAVANGGISPDRVVVLYERGVSAAATVRTQARRLAGGDLLLTDSSLPRDVLRVPNGNASAIARQIRGLPGVRDAYADVLASADLTVNDPQLGKEWALKTIQAATAWDTSQGSGVKVAVLDCGIDTGHPDLAGKTVLERNFTASPTTNDLCNHGTHVAGTIAANTDNSVGVAAVAPGAMVLNGKVLNDTGSGFFSSIDTAIQWAADNGAKVISMSLGGTTTCPTGTQAAANYAWSKGAVIVAAAGNSSVAGAMAPANCQNVIGVAATDSRDTMASFSNFGPEVDVGAPGVSILSTVNPTLNAGKEYASFSGTSMATPHVAGVLALIWATSPGASPAAVRDRLFTTADQTAGTGTSWTYGRINAAAAVAGGGLPPPDGLPAAPTTLSVSTRSAFVRLSWSASTTGGVSYAVYRGTVPGGSKQAVAADLSRTRWDDRSGLSGQQYCYQVTARNDVGESPPSQEACVIAP